MHYCHSVVLSGDTTAGRIEEKLGPVENFGFVVLSPNPLQWKRTYFDHSVCPFMLPLTLTLHEPYTYSPLTIDVCTPSYSEICPALLSWLTHKVT